MAGPNISIDSAGNLWDTSSGTPRFVGRAPGVSPLAKPGIQYEEPQAATNLAKSKLELQQAEAQAAADTRIKQAQALQEETKAANAKFEAGDALGDAKLTGPARLASVPDSQRPLVQLLLNNQLSQLGAFSLKSPQMQSLLSTAKAIDPNFDPSVMGARYQAIKDFTGEGKGAVAIGAVDRLAANLKTLKAISDQMGGPNIGWAPGNSMIAGAEQSFEPKLRASYDALAPEVARQFDRVMKQIGAPTVSGTQEIEQSVIGRDRSLDERNSAFQAMVNALHGALQPLRAQWDSAYGGKTPPPMWLSPEASQFFSEVDPQNASTYKYESHPLPGLHGDVNPLAGGPPPPPSGPAGGPPSGPPPVGPTPPDYSGMVGGPQAAVATGQYRNQFDPVMANAFTTFIRHGAPYATAAAYAQSHGFVAPAEGDYNTAVQFAKEHGGATNVSSNRLVPTTIGERLSASPLAAGIAGAASGATAGLSDVAGRSLVGPAWDANRAALAATNPTADLIGNVAGGAAGMFGAGSAAGNLLSLGAKGGLARNALAMALKNPVATNALGDTAYSSLYGASENPDNPLAGAATGAAVGPFASIGGQYATKGLGAALRGVQDASVQRLSQAGIPLTVGEVLGGGFKKAQDAMTSVFGPGNMVARRYNDGRLALNNAAFNEAGQTIGTPINAVGQKGIQALNAAKNNAYESALNPISLDLNNPQTISGIGGALNAAKAIPNVDQASDIATGGLANYIGNAAPNGVMSGTDFQQAYRGLSRLGRQSSSRIYGHEIGDALGQGQDALVNALQAQNPGAFDQFLAANSANRHLSVLSKAVDAAKNQIGDNGEPLFTPAQLGTAASQNARTYNGTVAAASGQRPFNQLAMDAQKVMSSKLPESGTFPRALMGAALTGGISGVGGMFGGQANGVQGAAEGAAIPLGLLTLLGSRRGQSLLTSALLNRTQADQFTGRMLLRNPQVGGDILTAAGIPLLAGP